MTAKNINLQRLSLFLSDKFDLAEPDIFEALNEFIEESKPKSGEIIIVLKYSERSNAIFGDTKPIKDQLMALNGEKRKVATFSMNLAFGPGYVSPCKYLEEIRGLLATLDVNVREVSREDYELEFSGGTGPKTKAVPKVKIDVPKVKVDVPKTKVNADVPVAKVSKAKIVTKQPVKTISTKSKTASTTSLPPRPVPKKK